MSRQVPTRFLTALNPGKKCLKLIADSSSYVLILATKVLQIILSVSMNIRPSGNVTW